MSVLGNLVLLLVRVQLVAMGCVELQCSTLFAVLCSAEWQDNAVPLGVYSIVLRLALCDLVLLCTTPHRASQAGLFYLKKQKNVSLYS